MEEVRLTKRGRIVLVEVPVFLTSGALGMLGGYIITLWFGLHG